MRRAGYTLIEVMTAVVVMTIGATGILAMQGASVRANQDASETTTAINFGSNWIERVKRDARRWIANGSTDLASTTYLSAVGSAASAAWFVPAASAPESAGADYFGFDTTVDANVRFCVNLALTVSQAYNPVTNTNLANSDANTIRADVRVWWHRSGTDIDRTVGSLATCRTTPLTAANAARPQIRKTYLSTVVGWTDLSP